MAIYNQETGGFLASANLSGTESPNHALNAANSATDYTTGHLRIFFGFNPKRYYDDIEALGVFPNIFLPWPAGGSDCWVTSEDATNYTPRFTPSKTEMLYTPDGTWADYLSQTTPSNIYRFFFSSGLNLTIDNNWRTIPNTDVYEGKNYALTGDIFTHNSFNFTIESLRCLYVDGEPTGASFTIIVVEENFVEHDITSLFSGIPYDDSFPFGGSSDTGYIDVQDVLGLPPSSKFFIRIKFDNIQMFDNGDNFGQLFDLNVMPFV